VNHKKKGSAGEYRAMRMLEALGFYCLRSAGSHGPIDVLAFDAVSIRAIQVKTGDHAACSPAEREALKLLPLPACASREVWVFKNYARQPLITRL
jgi:Holliday junction resolvase